MQRKKKRPNVNWYKKKERDFSKYHYDFGGIFECIFLGTYWGNFSVQKDDRTQDNGFPIIAYRTDVFYAMQYGIISNLELVAVMVGAGLLF